MFGFRDPIGGLRVRHLENLQHLDEVIAESANRPVFLFKHSSRCSISAAAQRRFAEFVRARQEGADAVFAHLDLIRHRDVSDAVASRLGVPHRSPQAILVHGGAVWHTSHGAITEDALGEALATVVPPSQQS